MFLKCLKKKKVHKTIDIHEMKAFHEMLLKMKKKRPLMDVNRLMKLIYKENFDPNKFL